VNLVLSQDIPSSDPVDQGEEETWNTVGAAAERSISLHSTIREFMPGLAQQRAATDNSQTSAEERRTDPSPATMAEQSEEGHAEDKAIVEARILDIAIILGAPTVTVVRSTL
jgi:hypothetical protein